MATLTIYPVENGSLAENSPNTGTAWAAVDDAAGAPDDIPEIAPGASAAWTLIASEGTSFNAAGRFHNLYLK